MLFNPSLVDTQQITRLASASSGSQTITTNGPPIMVFFCAFDNSDAGISSNGYDTVNFKICASRRSIAFLTTLLGALGVGSQSTMDNTVSINVQTTGGVGWSASVTNFGPNNFTINWTKLGAGRDITIQYSVLI